VRNWPCKLSLAIPLWLGATSKTESCGVNRHTVWCIRQSRV